MFELKLKCDFTGSLDITSSDRQDFTLNLMSSSSRQVFEKYVLSECYDRVAKLEDRLLTLKNIDIKYNIDRNIVVSLEKHLDNIDTEV